MLLQQEGLEGYELNKKPILNLQHCLHSYLFVKVIKLLCLSLPQSIYVHNMMKLYSAILTKAEDEEDTETIEGVNQMLQEKLPAFAESADLEVQERVSETRKHFQLFTS